MSDAAAGPEHERIDYGASGGRKTLFCFLFLILLPFFISLPAMLFMRLKNGLWQDTIGLAIIATGFTIIMFLIVIELMFSLRARVHLGEDSVRMTLPSGRGPTPMLRYRSYDIPYDDIHSVETRREIYGGALVPMLLQGARVQTKDGKAIPLGYVSEKCIDPCFPYPEIARKIAERARLPMIDRGHVRRSLRHKMLRPEVPQRGSGCRRAADRRAEPQPRQHGAGPRQRRAGADGHRHRRRPVERHTGRRDGLASHHRLGRGKVPR